MVRGSIPRESIFFLSQSVPSGSVWSDFCASVGRSGESGSRTSAAAFLEHQNALTQPGVHEQQLRGFSLSYCVDTTEFHDGVVLCCCEERRSNSKRALASVHSALTRSLRHATTDLDGSKKLRDMFNRSAHPRFQGSLVLPQHEIIQKTAS